MNALLTQQKQTRRSRLPLSKLIPGWAQVALFGWMICWGNHPPSAQCSYDPGVEYVAVGTARIDYSKSSPEQSDGRAERERASQTDFATAGYYFVYGSDGRLYGRYTPVKNQNLSRDYVGRVNGSSQSMSGTSLLNETIAWNPDGTQSGNSITRNGSVSASDPRTYGYNQRGELLLQNFSPSSGQNGSATYQFDGGAAGGLGLRTGVTLGTAMSGVTAQSYSTFARLGSMSVSGSLTNNSVGTPVAQTYDAAGNVTTRTAGGSTDTLTWDAFGQLVRDVRTGTGAFTWSAVYDGLGRRLQTTQGALTVQSSYDPEIEFLELVTKINGTRNWKVYGPDLDGRYGGLNGTGGLEAVYNQSTSTATYVLSDTYGHGEGVLNGTTFTWNPSQSDGYGALAGSSAAAPINASSVLGNLIGWRGHYIDATGLYYLGARYYAPDSGTFLSPDPLGHSASMDLYSYCNGDPVNNFDADGRSWNQVFGVMRAVGGVGETVAGYSLTAASVGGGVVSTPTGIGPLIGAVGATAGITIGAHGIDQFQTGVRQAIYDIPVDSITSQGLQSLGMTKGAANITDSGMSVIGSIGAGTALGITKTILVKNTESLAQGMSLNSVANTIEKGSVALNSTDYTLLGGFSGSTAFQRGIMLANGVDAYGQQFAKTTSFLQSTGKSFQLAADFRNGGAGLTPLGDIASGFAGSIMGGGANMATLINYQNSTIPSSDPLSAQVAKWK